MINPFSNIYMQYGVKAFFKYFLSIWVVTFLFASAFAYFDLKLENNYGLIISLEILYSLLLISILALFIVHHNSKLKLIVKEDFAFTTQEILIGILIGTSLGGLLPYIANSGMYLDEVTVFYEFTKSGIDFLQKIVNQYETRDLIIKGLLDSIMFPAFRALFFFGILYTIFKKTMNLTRASIQLTVFFALSNLFFQTNQIDVISLFGLGIILCYLLYRTQSLVVVLIASIFYDFPIYIYMMFSDFKIDAAQYLVPSVDVLPFIVTWFTLGFFGFYVLNIFYRVNDDV